MSVCVCERERERERKRERECAHMYISLKPHTLAVEYTKLAG